MTVADTVAAEGGLTLANVLLDPSRSLDTAPVLSVPL